MEAHVIPVGLFLFAVFLTSCAPPDPNSKIQYPSNFQNIINGDEPHSSIAPSVVYVSNCSGVLVSPHTIMTAAHCFKKNSTSQVAGTAAVTEPRNVLEIAYYPQAKLKKELRYPDIALVRIKDSIEGRVPARLHEKPIRKNEILSLVGFGRGTRNPKLSPDQINVRIIPSDFLTLLNLYKKESAKLRYYALIYRDYTNHGALLALPSKNQSICFGDSGGPAWSLTPEGYKVSGLNSAIIPHSLGTSKCVGPGISEGAYLQIITPVYPVLRWIKSITAKWQ